MCSKQLDNFLHIAGAEVGYIEGPADNQTKYQKANQPWCGAFVNWCAKQVALKIPDCTYTPNGAKAFVKEGTWQDAEGATPLPGDLAFFDFRLQEEESWQTQAISAGVHCGLWQT